MTQHRIHDYRGPRSSEDLNSKFVGILPPGVYRGFHVSATGTIAPGVLLTDHGVRIEESEPVVVIVPPGDPTHPRRDLVVCIHEYQKTVPAVPAIFQVVAGTPAPTPTLPLVPDHATLLAACQMPAGGTEWSSVYQAITPVRTVNAQIGPEGFVITHGDCAALMSYFDPNTGKGRIFVVPPGTFPDGAPIDWGTVVVEFDANGIAQVVELAGAGRTTETVKSNADLIDQILHGTTLFEGSKTFDADTLFLNAILCNALKYQAAPGPGDAIDVWAALIPRGTRNLGSEGLPWANVHGTAIRVGGLLRMMAGAKIAADGDIVVASQVVPETDESNNLGSFSQRFAHGRFSNILSAGSQINHIALEYNAGSPRVRRSVAKEVVRVIPACAGIRGTTGGMPHWDAQDGYLESQFDPSYLDIPITLPPGVVVKSLGVDLDPHDDALPGEMRFFFSSRPLGADDTKVTHGSCLGGAIEVTKHTADAGAISVTISADRTYWVRIMAAGHVGHRVYAVRIAMDVAEWPG